MVTDTRHTKTLRERMEILEKTISNPEFRTSRGKANEVNYWVFDYDPEDELLVRKGIRDIQKKSEGQYPLQVFDVYDIMMDYLKGRGYLEKVFTMEEKKGLAGAAKAISHTLRMSGDSSDNKLVEYLSTHADPDSILFLTGIGKSYPILRAQEVFNQVFYNMPAPFSATPMVLFYPGIYTELELKIFGKVKEGNYYRAFRIVR